MLEREVRANLAYRTFTRIGDGKVSDAKTLARIGEVVGSEVIRDLHERLVALARERGVVHLLNLFQDSFRLIQDGSRHRQQFRVLFPPPFLPAAARPVAQPAQWPPRA
jgi:hypothetical protein